MKRLLNRFLATIQLALRRTWTALGSHAAVALGVLVATTTICALLLYAEAVNVAVLRDRLARAHEDAVYDLLIKGAANLVDGARYRAMDETIARQVQEMMGCLSRAVGGTAGPSRCSSSLRASRPSASATSCPVPASSSTLASRTRSRSSRAAFRAPRPTPRTSSR
jgi:hypothetical protein